MFLEAQFGAENLTPIASPRLPSNTSPSAIEEAEGSEDEEQELETLQKQEIERLHKIGIPVPGVEIKVDKMVAKVWLEDLEVEAANKVFGDRVRAVVERAVEVTAPLWA
jgi:cleavage and polyadenylation specificity factor subunit 3